MNARNLICWAVCLGIYVGLVFLGNAGTIEMKRTRRSPWTRVWQQIESNPLPAAAAARSTVEDGDDPGRRPPPAAPEPISEETAHAAIRGSVCKRRADDLIPRVRRSIRVVPWPVDTEAQLGQGVSRMTAAPDLPAGFRWPTYDGRPLALIAQLNLAEVAEYDTETRLPATGWLCFFYASGHRPVVLGTHPDDDRGWEVAYFDGDVTALERVTLPGGQVEEYPPCLVRFWGEWTLPSLAEEPELIKARDPCQNYYRDLCEALSGRPDVPGWHHLLGHAQNVWGPMRRVCAAASAGDAWSEEMDVDSTVARRALREAEDWVLLLQVELDSLQTLESVALAGSEPEPAWGGFYYASSSGDRVYYWIRDEDLRARDFSRVWCVRQGFYDDEPYEYDSYEEGETEDELFGEDEY